jgi:hypothetical protein
MNQNQNFGKKVTIPTFELFSCPTIHIQDMEHARKFGGNVLAKIYDRAKGLRIDKTEEDDLE